MARLIDRVEAVRGNLERPAEPFGRPLRRAGLSLELGSTTKAHASRPPERPGPSHAQDT